MARARSKEVYRRAEARSRQDAEIVSKEVIKMKNAMLLAVVSLVSFVGGLTIHSTSQAQKKSNQDSAPASSPIPCPQKDEFPKLIEDKHVTKFNGSRLNLDYG